MRELFSTTSATPGYRQDIDGLRAIAVLSVVIFHIQEWLIPGGFVGVDIFFVISGFLISQQLYKQINTNTFSLLEFYRRRVRRIVPAMLVVVLITMVLSQFLFRPEDAEKVAESGIAAVLSWANLYFWLFQDTGYFASSSLEIPLLHLWSLGVEEQFYVFWPLLLLLLKPALMSRGVFIGLSILALSSYALAEALYFEDPSQTYYMLHTRAGELILGALAAHWVHTNPEPSRFKRWSGAMRILGYGLIGYSMVALSDHDVFPGWAALPPTLGAALILIAGHIHQGKSARPLQWPGMRFFGLISYSLYLWHWPLLAFWRYGNLPIDLLTGPLLFFIMTVLAWLTYRWVEQPLRHSQLSAWPTIGKYYVAPAIMMTVMGLAFMKLDGYGHRWFFGEYKSALSASRIDMAPASHHKNVCQFQSLPVDGEVEKECVIGPDGAREKAFLFGDSNAAHYVGVLTPTLNALGITLENQALGSCPPLYQDIEQYAPQHRIKDCQGSMPVLWEKAKAFERVIISASYLAYQDIDGRFIETFLRQLEEFRQEGQQILLLGKMPEFKGYDRTCREKVLSMPWIDCQVSDAPMDHTLKEMNKRLQQYAQANENIFYWDMESTLCPDGACSLYSESGHVLYYDGSHMSNNAGWAIGAQLLQSKQLRLFGAQ